LLLLLLLGLAIAWAWVAGAFPTAAGEARVVPASPDLSAYPWLFLRDGQDLAAGESLASLIAVGDVMLGRDVPADPSPWQEVAGWLPAADLTLGNLEAVLTDETSPRSAPAGEPQPIILRAGPEQAYPLSMAGFDILGLANNHALDYGPVGLSDTVAALQGAGLAPIGLLAPDGIQQPLIREVNGVRLAFLAFNAVPVPGPVPGLDQGCPAGATCWPVPAAWDRVAGPAAIAAARLHAQAVIVSIHWGFEYQLRPDPYQEAIAEAMLAAGADLILGHHPHVAQPIAVTGDRVVAYSLGNFVFDQTAGDTRYGLALRAFFDDQGLRAVQVEPLQAGPQPHLLKLAEADGLLSRVLPRPPRIGFLCDGPACSPFDAPQTSQTGLFYAGQIDLTGDGRPETVRRAGPRIAIYDAGALVWQSPESWQVVDAALGDPNDDGRYEIMLAIWQKDAAGYQRSQPYIVGYRGGRYTLLWGGRPVGNPIQELAVGDVDGDGADELVVVEEFANGYGQAVSVWRWAGWTFSLIWRSDAGPYHDLVLEEQDQGPPILSLVKE
jgi:poly-gamma-glutamate capsule biosynthesis protein CapA/YwtB (metallophosphatase superfamily)